MSEKRQMEQGLIEQWFKSSERRLARRLPQLAGCGEREHAGQAQVAS